MCLTDCILIVATGAIGIGLLYYFINKWLEEREKFKFIYRPNELRYKEDTKRAWEYHKDADRQTAERTNYVIVAESMLLLSFVTSITSLEEIIIEIPRFIALVGIVITFSWGYLNLRTETRIALLKSKYLVKNDPVYWDYVKTAFSGLREPYFIIWIPNTILLLWVYLVFYTLDPTDPTGNILIKSIFSWELILVFILVLKWYGISEAKSNISKPDC